MPVPVQVEGSELADEEAVASVLTDRNMHKIMGTGAGAGVKQEDMGEDASAVQVDEGGAGQEVGRGAGREDDG